jgi:hypothetical protein
MSERGPRQVVSPSILQLVIYAFASQQPAAVVNAKELLRNPCLSLNSNKDGDDNILDKRYPLEA